MEEPEGRWDRLFADLEVQAAEQQRAELEGELPDKTRHARGEVPLVDRLRAVAGRQVTLRLAGGLIAAGVVGDVAQEWLVLLQDGASSPSLVPTSVIVTAQGLSRHAVPAGRLALAPLTLRSMLRVIARDRSPLRLWLTDGRVLEGTLDEVGLDHVDLAAHPLDVARRSGAVRQGHLVVLSALALLRPVEGTTSLGW
jgi:hypothetical protein